MAAFLSTDWLTRLDAAARAAGVSGEPLIIEHRIGSGDGCAGDEACYHVCIDGSGARVVAGAAPSPTVTFSHDRDTARAIACGELRAQQAVIEGRTRVRGDVAALVERRDDLGRLDAALATVGADTEY